MAAVSLYAAFYDYDLATMGAASFHLALLNSSYTFDATAVSAAAILTSNETVGSGYARISGVNMVLDTATPPDALYELQKSGGAPTFGVMTTTDYRYLFLYDSGSDAPLAVADAGSLQTLSGAGLIVAGDFLALIGP